MRISVVGSGAVGLYYGARLQKSGEDVRFLLKSDYETIMRSGIKVRGADSSFQLNDVKGYLDSREMGKADLVIVATKAVDNNVLPSLIRPLLERQTAILTLQNGLGNVEFLKTNFPSNPVLGGSCFICLNRQGQGVVENYYLGSIAISEHGSSGTDLLKQIVAMMNRANLNCRISHDLRLMQWKKLLWNVPFNGLSIAAGQVTTDVILSDEGLRRLARGLMEEVVAAAGALGMEIAPELIERQFEVTKAMGEYQPSSLVDYLAGRKVEVEAIWGEPLRQALQAGLDLPKLETLYRLLKITCNDRV